MSSENHLRRPTGSLIGRGDEVRAVRAGIDRGRLVSLVGSGGVGKTALAAEVAHEVEPEFQRVVVVELANLDDPAGVLRLLSNAVLDQADETPARVASALDGVATLVIIDNCEHLIDEVADVVRRLLDLTTSLQIIVTSRRPLGLADEVIVTVHPLPTPTGHNSDRELTSAPAIQLFLERVRQAVPTFELTETNRPLVADIVRAADGVPLLIELAAALVRSRPLDEILLAMTERLDTLGDTGRDRPPQQRTLGASLDWSRRFLDPQDARFLDRLSVFAGGFTAEGARWLNRSPGEAPGDDFAGTDGLSRLVDHSLVDFDVETGRYRLLEVVRVDAVARLSSDERLAAEQRHFDWCLVVVGRIERGRFAADPDLVFHRFEWELPNLCAAAQRCLDRADLDGFRALVGPVAVWLVHYVPPTDPDIWSKAFAGDDVPLLWRANIESALAFYWSHRGRHDRALGHAEIAVERHEEVGDLVGQGLALLAVGNAQVALEQRSAARESFEASLSLALANDSPYPELLARLVLARLDASTPEARRHLEAALPLAKTGFTSIEALVSVELGLLALGDGDLEQARRLCNDGLSIARAHGYAEALATALCACGEVAATEGHSEQKIDEAARLFEEALDIGRASFHEGVIERAQAGLDSIEQLRIGGLGPEASSRSRTADAEALSERELAVARLLRGDLTQREIAEELYIAPSTVKTHTKSIYRKLGVSKRSHAITRAAELGLFG